MDARRVVRTFSAMLCAFFLLLYIAAKIDFFSRYFRLGPENYFREHSIYWAAMAVIAFVLWLIEKR
jgi:hypothetical protein